MHKHVYESFLPKISSDTSEEAPQSLNKIA